MKERQGPKVLRIDPSSPDAKLIAEAAAAIRQGLLVAFPTETVYGLGANALMPDAVMRIYEVKGRPPDNPIIVHIGYKEDVWQVAAEFPPKGQLLAERFWPGPLTLVLPRSSRISDIVTAGLDTVAVRMPAHPIALALIREAGVPVAAPSANKSGRPSPTLAQHVMDDLGALVDIVVDGGPCPVGVESTVVDVTGPQPVILRPGGVSREELESVLGQRVAVGDGEKLKRSPGTRYRHYAPRAQVIVASPSEIAELVTSLAKEGKKVGIIARQHILVSKGVATQITPRSLRQYAQQLFAALRELDKLGCDVIVAEAVEPRGLGLAIMDRLRRASAGPRGGREVV